MAGQTDDLARLSHKMKRNSSYLILFKYLPTKLTNLRIFESISTNILKFVNLVGVFFSFFKMVTIHRVKRLFISKSANYTRRGKWTSRPLNAPKFSTLWTECNFSTWLEFLLNSQLIISSSERLIPCILDAYVLSYMIHPCLHLGYVHR